MNAPVDCLAVIDRAAVAAIGERNAHDANNNEAAAEKWEKLRADLREVQDALAELIDTSREILADMNSVAPKYRSQQSVDELTDALARIGGAA